VEKEKKRIQREWESTESNASKESAAKVSGENREKISAEQKGFQGPDAGQLAPSNLRFSRYYQSIWGKIRGAWLLPEYGMDNQETLEAIVVIKIRKDGKILSSEFEKKSGNVYLDRSVMRAVKKADPLPPFPGDLREDIIEIGLRFIPSTLDGE
jgi:TonB family protein